MLIGMSRRPGRQVGVTKRAVNRFGWLVIVGVLNGRPGRIVDPTPTTAPVIYDRYGLTGGFAALIPVALAMGIPSCKKIRPD